ncbi:MAG: hypothetical protein ACI4L8_11710 [Candidatus Fimadaptatus sp.]
MTRNSRQYALTAVGLSVISGVTGLHATSCNVALYLNTRAGGGDAAFNPARNVTRNSRQYALTAVGLSLVSGVTGLHATSCNVALYLNTRAGGGDAAFNPVRNVTRNSRQYALTAVGLSLVSGVTGFLRRPATCLSTSHQRGGGRLPSGKICPDSYI